MSIKAPTEKHTQKKLLKKREKTQKNTAWAKAYHPEWPSPAQPRSYYPEWPGPAQPTKSTLESWTPVKGTGQPALSLGADSPQLRGSGHAVVVVADPRHLHLRLRRRRGHRQGARPRSPQALPRPGLGFGAPPPRPLPRRAAGRAAPPRRPRRIPPPLRVLPPHAFPLLHTASAVLRGHQPPLPQRPRR